MKNALQFLGALAIATEGDQTFTIALLKDEESGTTWERLEKAIQVFRKLSLDYGEKAVLEAGRQIRSIAAPSWDKLIAANKSYGSSMEDELSIQFRNSLLADGMPEDNYSAQYVQKWEAYQNTLHEHGAEYEGHPLFLERTISIYDDPDLTIRVRNSDLRYPGRSLSLYLIHKVPANQRIVPDQHFMARFEHLILPLMKSLGADLSMYYLHNLTEELVSHIIQNYKISGPNWTYRPLSIFTTKKGNQENWAFETDKMLMSNYTDQTFYDSFFSMLKSQEILKDR
ncbi:MAG: hypothetical protein R2828_00815 [Saprospiraceae bacterium]